MHGIVIWMMGFAQLHFQQVTPPAASLRLHQTQPQPGATAAPFTTEAPPEIKIADPAAEAADPHTSQANRLSPVDQQRLDELLRTPELTEIMQGATLRAGHQGRSVREIKELLNQLGYRLPADDVFNREMLVAVGQFQEQHQLAQRGSFHWGSVGPSTLSKLQEEAHWGRYSERLGQALVAYARPRVIGTERYCYRFVANAVHAVTEPFLQGYHAYMAADHLAGNRFFKEIYVPLADLEKLPAGAIVVWGKGRSRSGHISIADGQGNEISDHIRPQMLSHYGGASYRAFLPVEPR